MRLDATGGCAALTCRIALSLRVTAVSGTGGAVRRTSHAHTAERRRAATAR